ncbi:MAG: endonuclease domain-containing protein [Bacteroidota bacterium]
MKKHLAQHSRSLMPIARVLRKQMTDAERKLWALLRGNQLGVKFRRQFPCGRYVVDFYSAKAKLIIELDGSQHYTNKGMQNDIERDDYLHGIGCKVIRYSNFDIFENEDGVMQDIYEHVKVRTGKSLDPL